MTDVTDEQLAELADAISDMQGMCSDEGYRKCQRIILTAAPLLVWALRDARDVLARDPVRAAIEYDHWRDAAIANRNEADSLRERITAVEKIGTDLSAAVDWEGKPVLWERALGGRILAALAAPTGQEAGE